MEAIILAGGLGTRLRSEVSALPKAMAPINDRPFLEYQLDQLVAQGVTKVVFSLGYKAEFIQSHFGNHYHGCELVYVVEETRLGTGGAIKHALPYTTAEHVFILNGDSIHVTNLRHQLEVHLANQADATLALKPMVHFERYGTVELDADQRVIRFNEKQPVAQGNISTGIYVFNTAAFNQLSFPEKFSIENDFFASHVGRMKFMGVPSGGYFLDIGIPEDFKKAQTEIGAFSQVDSSWTLFLDRDGVINKKRDNDYVKNLGELELLPGAVEAVAQLSLRFGRTVVVTNQQGIGKGLMTEDDLRTVHDHIAAQVAAHGGRIDAFYHAPQLAAENSPMRKPNAGMALQAQQDVAGIDFSKSIMVGDSPSDMAFGQNAGMHTVFIAPKTPDGSAQYTLPSLVALQEMIASLSKP